MDRHVTTTVNEALCVGCGRCVAVCPYDTLEVVGEKARVVGKESLHCGHCQAACPQGAIAAGVLDPSVPKFETIDMDTAWVRFGKPDSAALAQLMASRRSCRSYRDTKVEPALLRDVVTAGTLAPSGTNSQLWTFTVLPNRRAVERLGRQVAVFFRLLNRVSEKPWLRRASWLAPGDPLGTYFRDYHDRIAEGLDEWDRGGRDRLFHGAPAAILVGAAPGASCPAEDALLAAQNMALWAHSAGLGSCLIGFAVEAIKWDGRIKRQLGIPKNEKVHAVLALGYPKEKYKRVAGRKVPITRFFEEGK